MRTKIIPRIRQDEFEFDFEKAGDEAKICLNCPYVECINTENCKRFKEERAKIKRRV